MPAGFVASMLMSYANLIPHTISREHLDHNVRCISGGTALIQHTRGGTGYRLRKWLGLISRDRSCIRSGYIS